MGCNCGTKSSGACKCDKCQGKEVTFPIFTRAIKYDGSDLLCEGSDLTITSGDCMNDVIATYHAELCNLISNPPTDGKDGVCVIFTNHDRIETPSTLQYVLPLDTMVDNGDGIQIDAIFKLSNTLGTARIQDITDPMAPVTIFSLQNNFPAGDESSVMSVSIQLYKDGADLKGFARVDYISNSVQRPVHQDIDLGSWGFGVDHTLEFAGLDVPEDGAVEDVIIKKFNFQS